MLLSNPLIKTIDVVSQSRLSLFYRALPGKVALIDIPDTRLREMLYEPK